MLTVLHTLCVHSRENEQTVNHLDGHLVTRKHTTLQQLVDGVDGQVTGVHRSQTRGDRDFHCMGCNHLKHDTPDTVITWNMTHLTTWNNTPDTVVTSKHQLTLQSLETWHTWHCSHFIHHHTLHSPETWHTWHCDHFKHPLPLQSPKTWHTQHCDHFKHQLTLQSPETWHTRHCDHFKHQLTLHSPEIWHTRHCDHVKHQLTLQSFENMTHLTLWSFQTSAPTAIIWKQDTPHTVITWNTNLYSRQKMCVVFTPEQTYLQTGCNTWNSNSSDTLGEVTNIRSNKTWRKRDIHCMF